MKRNNLKFIEEIKLLDSQENSEEIVWSSSSSEYETNSWMNPRKHQKKRKEIKKLFTNRIFNLDLEISDVSEDDKHDNTSPILKQSLINIVSNCNENKLPVKETMHQQSNSPIFVPKSSKRKFSSVLKSKENNTNVCKRLIYRDEKEEFISKKNCGYSTIYDKHSPIFKQKKDHLCVSNKNHYSMNKKLSFDLVEKAKTDFQQSLSKDSLSQQSISEYSTSINSSKSSDEVEIIDFSQGLPVLLHLENSGHVVESTVKTKKIKYKKDGLAYRLDNLLKKQQANVSLWQHEQYLASNSDFTVPKEPFLAFRITKVDFKFSCYLIQAISEKDEEFCILVNNLYAKDNLAVDLILKLYKPYNIIDFKDTCKLIVNVCKFTCESIKLN